MCIAMNIIRVYEMNLDMAKTGVSYLVGMLNLIQNLQN